MKLKMPWFKILCAQTFLVAAGFIAVWFALPYHSNAPKIAYVDTSRLMMEYTVAKTNRAEIDSLTKDWQTKAKVLKDSLDAHMAAMGSLYDKLTPARKAELRADLEKHNLELDQYVKASQEKVRQRDIAISEPTMKRINSCLRDIANSQNFDIIFGSTGSGNILAGTPRLDITTRVIAKLNER